LTHDAVSSPDTIEVFASASENVLYEPFDADWVGTPSAPEYGWSQISVSGSSPWRRSTSYGGTAYGPWASAGGEHVLITPQLDLTGAPDGYNLDFRLDGSSSSGTDLKVQISSQNADATTGWTDLAYYVAGSNMPSVFEDVSIDLSSYSDGNYYIAFRLLDDDGYSVYLDDVTVEPRPIVPILSLGLTEFNSIPTIVDSSRKVTIPYSNVGGGTDELSGTITYSRDITGPSTFDESSDSIEVVFTPIATGSFSGMVY
jgi:hypothetical protein